MISRELARHSECWDDVVSVTLSDMELDVEINASHGDAAEGKPFTLWTKRRVYFPTEWDGYDGCSSVSRVVDGKPTEGIG